jgi:hypothetical protein
MTRRERREVLDRILAMEDDAERLEERRRAAADAFQERPQ